MHAARAVAQAGEELADFSQSNGSAARRSSKAWCSGRAAQPPRRRHRGARDWTSCIRAPRRGRRRYVLATSPGLTPLLEPPLNLLQALTQALRLMLALRHLVHRPCSSSGCAADKVIRGIDWIHADLPEGHEARLVAAGAARLAGRGRGHGSGHAGPGRAAGPLQADRPVCAACRRHRHLDCPGTGLRAPGRATRPAPPRHRRSRQPGRTRATAPRRRGRPAVPGGPRRGPGGRRGRRLRGAAAPRRHHAGAGRPHGAAPTGLRRHAGPPSQPPAERPGRLWGLDPAGVLERSPH
jgi:hypothetical protein